jgi:hypothetical protein
MQNAEFQERTTRPIESIPAESIIHSLTLALAANCQLPFHLPEFVHFPRVFCRRPHNSSALP